MRETGDDLDWMQALLDDSYAQANPHLTSIHTGPARLTAQDVADRLQGMQVFVVATVSADGRPLTGPVDAFLYRGRVHFATSPDALRARHLRRRPAVSATHVQGEGLVVTVHGRGVFEVPDEGFAEVLGEHYGADWDEWGGGSPYVRIEPDKMFAADMTVHQASA